jgi:hypothetical protein
MGKVLEGVAKVAGPPVAASSCHQSSGIALVSQEPPCAQEEAIAGSHQSGCGIWHLVVRALVGGAANGTHPPTARQGAAQHGSQRKHNLTSNLVSRFGRCICRPA